MRTLSTLPNDTLILLLQFIGQPIDFLHMLTVSKEWYDKFDCKDAQLWLIISKVYDVAIYSFPSLSNIRSNTSRSLRSTNDYKRLFMKHYFRKLANMDERHNQLVVQAKALLNSKRDQPRKLERLIHSTFVTIGDFNVDFRCPMMESNSLLTLACRYQQKKCVRLLVESYRAAVDIADMGGFTPLILATYQGCFSNVVYFLKRGADWRLRGRLRSGPLLTAEHWAAIKGHLEILRYLHAIRGRYSYRRLKSIPSKVDDGNHSGPSPSTPSNPTKKSNLSISSHVLPSISFDLDMQDRVAYSSAESYDRLQGHDGMVVVSSGLSATSSSSLDAKGDYRTAFCLCGEGFTGNMVACDGTNCPVEWFHYGCVGLVSKVSSLYHGGHAIWVELFC